MIVYSHIWDGVLKLASIVLLTVLLIALHVDRALGVAAMIAILVVLWLVIYRQGLSTIASWLYARVSLGADVSLAEARRLACLFQLDLSVQWVPLREIKKLPKAERRSAVLAALERIGPRRRAMLI